MIDIDKKDIIATRRTSDGRFVIFTGTDVRPSWPLRWWGAVADTGGDGFGLLARLDGLSAPDGWTARQLLAVAQARMAAEGERHPSTAAAEAVAHLELAAAAFREPTGQMAPDAPVVFEPGDEASPYGWTVARCGAFRLQLCPDPEGQGEGVTPQQVLIVLDQLLHDGARAFSFARGLWVCRSHVAAALAAEVRRLEAVRANAPQP